MQETFHNPVNGQHMMSQPVFLLSADPTDTGNVKRLNVEAVDIRQHTRDRHRVADRSQTCQQTLYGESSDISAVGRHHRHREH
jgi:hypothetical protein